MCQGVTLSCLSPRGCVKIETSCTFVKHPATWSTIILLFILLRFLAIRCRRTSEAKAFRAGHSCRESKKSFARRTKGSRANSSAERFSQGCQNRCPLRGFFRKGTKKADEIVDNDLWELGAGNSWQCSSEPKYIVPVLGDVLRINVFPASLAPAQIEPGICVQR